MHVDDYFCAIDGKARPAQGKPCAGRAVFQSRLWKSEGGSPNFFLNARVKLWMDE